MASAARSPAALVNRPGGAVCCSRRALSAADLQIRLRGWRWSCGAFHRESGAATFVYVTTNQARAQALCHRWCLNEGHVDQVGKPGMKI